MQLGECVNGLMMNRHWRFVVSDTHNVAEAVNRHDAKTRLVAHDRTMQVAIARFIDREHLGADDIDKLVGAPVTDRGGAWMLVFHPKGPDGQEIHGDPDMSVLEQLRKRDLWATRRGVNARQILRDMEKMNEIREEAAARRMAERMFDMTEQAMFASARARRIPFWPNRIYVPADIPKSAIER